MTSRRRSPFIAATLLVAATGALAWFPRVLEASGSEHALALFLALCALAAGAFLRIATFAWREPEPATRGRWAILAFALLLRAPALAADPWLSDDVWRYLWEGKVARAGFSPYVFAPDAPELVPLRDAVHARVAHREVSAVYPPLAQGLFRLMPEHALAWKSVVLAADVALLLLLARALARNGSPPRRLLLYGAHPLVVLAGAASGHVDVIAWLPLFAGLLVVAAAGPQSQLRRWVGGIATGAAALLKPQGLAPLARFVRAKDGCAIAGVVATVALGFAPFAHDGSRLFAGTARYAHDWEFNGLVYPPCVQLSTALKAGLEALPDQPFHLWKVREAGYAIVPNQLARKLALALFVVVAFALTRRLANQPIVLCFALLAAFLATAPAVHPWYVAWLVPFLPLLPRRAARAALLLTLTTLAAYAVRVQQLATGVWSEPPWLALVTWLPPCLLAAFDLWSAAPPAVDEATS